MNTIGKNELGSKTSLYLTCLPKRNSDHYKQIAIALYDNDLSLLTSDDNDNSNWFQDRKLEEVYRGELYSELLQIIHRTELRKIDSKTNINIYIAFDDEPNNIHTTFEYEPIIENINRVFLSDQAVIPKGHKLHDMSLYSRDKTLEGFIRQSTLKLEASNRDTISANSISNTFKKYLHNHWDSKNLIIKERFKEFGLDIFVDENDKRRPKKIKLLKSY